MTPSKEKSRKKSFRIKTVPSTGDLLKEKKLAHRFDTSIYHKTIFHLRPLKDNPELFVQVNPINTISKEKIQAIKNKTKNELKEIKEGVKKEQAILPASINIRK